MIKLIILFASVTVLAIPSTSAEACSPNERSYKNNCYVFHNEEISWKDAAESCKKSGSALVSNIEDKAENDFIGSISEKRVIWTALNKLGHTKQFLWLDGSKPSYTNWARNEPNNHNKDEYCTELYSVGYSAWHYTPGQWNDNSCSNKHYYVCKHKTRCVNGGTFYKNKCYVYHSENKNWNDASETCKKSGFELVGDIKDKAENDFITSLISKQVIWTGLNKIGHTKEFLWQDSSKPSYYNWGIGEPNNMKKNEYCVELISNPGNPKNKPGVWNDNPCSMTHPFVCQYHDEIYHPEVEIIYEEIIGNA